MIEDFCAFFSAIEADPEASVGELTVRDYLMIRMHLASCDKCREVQRRVCEKYPDDESPTIGFHVN